MDAVMIKSGRKQAAFLVSSFVCDFHKTPKVVSPVDLQLDMCQICDAAQISGIIAATGTAVPTEVEEPAAPAVASKSEEKEEDPFAKYSTSGSAKKK